ncbi:MAG: TolC family protein [Proteobacteria bacterium]|nr:TolC family protein [Pseudomonadota bacterium]
MNSVSYISLMVNVLWLGCTTLGAASVGEEANPIALSPTVLLALFAEARTNNSGLQTAEKRVTVSHLGLATVRQWEDPKFSFSGVIPGPKRGGLDAEGDLIYGIEQKLPLWNRPRLNRDIITTETQTQTAESAFREAQLRRGVTKALLRIALVHRTTSFITNDLAWLDTIITLGEEKFRAGNGSHVDLLVIQNEKSKRADAFRTEQNRLRTEQAALNRMLGRDLQAPWPAVLMPQLGPPAVYSPALAAYAATNEPRLKVLRQEKAQAVAVTRLTETMRRPDVSLGLQGRQYSGDGGIREGMITVSLNLPWWNAPKYRADLRRDEAKVRVVDAEITDYELSVREEVLRLTLLTDAAYREAVLYRDEIMQRTQQGMASYLAMWEGNRGLLRDILDARRNFLDAQLMQDRAVIEQHQSFAELAALCDLPDYFQLPRLLVQLGNGAHHPAEPRPPQM